MLHISSCLLALAVPVFTVVIIAAVILHIAGRSRKNSKLNEARR